MEKDASKEKVVPKKKLRQSAGNYYDHGFTYSQSVSRTDSKTSEARTSLEKNTNSRVILDVFKSISETTENGVPEWHGNSKYYWSYKNLLRLICKENQ